MSVSPLATPTAPPLPPLLERALALPENAAVKDAFRARWQQLAGGAQPPPKQPRRPLLAILTATLRAEGHEDLAVQIEGVWVEAMEAAQGRPFSLPRYAELQRLVAQAAAAVDKSALAPDERGRVRDWLRLTVAAASGVEHARRRGLPMGPPERKLKGWLTKGGEPESREPREPEALAELLADIL